MIRRVPFLIATAALAALAQSGGIVSGRVTSTLHGEAVAGATVELHGLDEGAQSYLCETGHDGRFSVANVAPGTYQPLPSKTGYEQRMPGRPVTSPAFPPIIVEAGKTSPPIELRLIPDGVIAGSVFDDEGDPLVRAAVEAQQYTYGGGKKQLRTVRSAQTDDRGQYRLFNLPAGRYRLHFAPGTPHAVAGAIASRAGPPSGLAPSYFPGTPDPARATELQVAPGMELDRIDIRLTRERLYSIRGRLIWDGSNEPVSVFAQRASFESGNRGVLTTRMGGDRFEITGAAPGRYFVTAQKSAGSQQKNSPWESARQTVEVVDRDVEHVDLALSPGITLKGVVTAEAPASIKDVNTIILASEESGGTVGGSGRVSPDGSFTSTFQSAPGTYRVRVSGSPLYLKTVLVGKEIMPDRKIDTRHLSGDLTLVIAADFGKLEGTVVDDGGKPVFNANVTMIADERREGWRDRFRSAFTKVDGKFSIPTVEPGEYKVYAWRDVEPGAAQDPDFRKPFEDRAVVVKMDSNGHQTIALKAIQPD